MQLLVGLATRSQHSEEVFGDTRRSDAPARGRVTCVDTEPVRSLSAGADCGGDTGLDSGNGTVA